METRNKNLPSRKALVSSGGEIVRDSKFADFISAISFSTSPFLARIACSTSATCNKESFICFLRLLHYYHSDGYFITGEYWKIPPSRKSFNRRDCICIIRHFEKKKKFFAPFFIINLQNMSNYDHWDHFWKIFYPSIYKFL